MWNHHKFSYHGSCDLLLLHQDKFRGVQLDIHVRTKHRGQFSYVASTAIRIGQDVFEVVGKDVVYYVNGEANPAMPNALYLFMITHVKESDTRQTFTIDLGNSQISIKTWYDFLSVSIENAQDGDFSNSVGLMGTYPTGEMIDREGNLVSDYAAFAESWQVRDTDDVLFQSMQMPQYPQKCVMPITTRTKQRRRLGESISDDAAAQACAHVAKDDFDFCVFDVITTNDLAAAGAY
jgi:hypothetical protein